jgi:RHS repeat-associated protein
MRSSVRFFISCIVFMLSIGFAYGQCGSISWSSGSPSYVCLGTGFTLTASGGTGEYYWYKSDSPGGTPDMGDGTGSTYTPTAVGSYRIYLGTSGCQGQGQMQYVDITARYPPATISAGPFTVGYNTPARVTINATLEPNEYCKWYNSAQVYLYSGSNLWVNLSSTSNFYVTRYDGYCESPQTLFTVNVDALPTASAGADKVLTLPTTSTTLAGSGTDVSSYTWKKISGPSSGTLTNTSSATLSLSGLVAGVYVFRLTITDAFGQTAHDDAVVTVKDPAAPNNYNYVTEQSMLVSGILDPANIPASITQKSVHTTYLSDLGRPMEEVQVKGSALQSDVIVPVVYDDLDRGYKQYLAVATPGSGLYTNVLDASGEYTGSVQNFYSDKPYAVTKYELSPLSRPVEQGKVGQVWQPGQTSGTTKIAYGANAAGLIRQWTISASGLPQSTATWGAATLMVKTTTDGISDSRQMVTEEYTSGDGLKILSRTKVDATTWSDTYYVYDSYRQLRFVLTPLLLKDLKAAGNYTVSQSQTDRLVYQYVYDNVGRVINQRSPGSDWVYQVYDALGRLTLSQDGNQRLLNKWIFYRYDGLDRVTVKGLYSPTKVYTRDEIQALVRGVITESTSEIRMGGDIVSSAYDGYKEYRASNSIDLKPGFSFAATATSTFRASVSSEGAPTLTNFPTSDTEDLVYTYYDAYTGNAFFSSTDFQFVTESGWQTSGGEPFVKQDNVRGQVTGVSVKVLGGTQWLSKVIYYNKNQQPLQVLSSNHTGGVSRYSTLSDFSGKMLESKLSQLSQTIGKRYQYDHAGRLLKVYNKLNSQPEILLSAQEYNEIGQVTDKKLYSTDLSTPAYLQSVDYGYSIQGRLTKVNSASGSDAGEVDYFGMELGYEGDNSSSTSAVTRKDGMISNMRWRNDLSTRQRLYTFDYDAMNRMSIANYKAGAAAAWTSQPDYFSEKNISYDYNGNLTSLQRMQKVESQASSQTIDNLMYAYGSTSGNQLMGVLENSTASMKNNGFKDGNVGSDDYAYDANGNLTLDKNKGITSITYTILNLPNRVTFSDASYVQYTYSSEGVKLSQLYHKASDGSEVKTDYVGDQVLVNDAPVVIFHDEGRLLPPSFVNLIVNKEANGTSGYSANLDVTLSSVSQGTETYVKAVSNQATGTPGVSLGSYTVKPGERYSFKILGYRETAQNAHLYVTGSGGDIVWTGSLLPQGLANETWSTNEFVVPAGITQVTIGVKWSNPVVNAALYINRAALYKIDWEYQYFIADQVGSPRVVLSTSPSTNNYVATFETENQTGSGGESNYFMNINTTRLTVHTSNVTPGGNEVIMLDKNFPIGPVRSLKVYPGDKIDASVSAYYAAMTGLTKMSGTVMAASLYTALAGIPQIPGVDGAIGTAYSNSASSQAGFSLSPDNGSTRPSAFLNYILFDENYVALEAKSVPVGSTAGASPTISFSSAFGSAVSIKQLGYMMVYLSYDNNSTSPVYFDELKITQEESPMVQVNDYYPFGLVSYSWIRDGEYENRFLYQGKELDGQTGWHDFGARQYDASVGRWFAGDPANEFSSPYVGIGNNPVNFTDPTGTFLGDFSARMGLVMVHSIFNAIRDKDISQLDPNKNGNLINNAIKIEQGLFDTDESHGTGSRVWEFVSRFTWEAPQTALGNGAAHYANILGKVNGVNHFHGATLLDTDSHTGAFTVGSYILGPENFGNYPDDQAFKDHLLVHEYGHYKQSHRFGPAYLLLVALPSASDFNLDKGNHHDRWYEAQASKYGAKYFNERWGEGAPGYVAGSVNYFDGNAFVNGQATAYQNPRDEGYNGGDHVTEGKLRNSDFLFSVFNGGFGLLYFLK